MADRLGTAELCLTKTISARHRLPLACHETTGRATGCVSVVQYAPPMAKAPKKPSRKVTWNTVRDLALALPDVEESTSYRTPAMKVRGKLIARLKEDGKTIVVPMPIAERDVRIVAEPDVFFVTDRYVSCPNVLVWLAKMMRTDLRELPQDAWRMMGGG